MKLNKLIFFFNIAIGLISFYVLVNNEFFLASFFVILIYTPVIILNRNCNYTSFFYFFVSINYIHRIPIICINKNEFWYDLEYYTNELFSNAIIYLTLIFGTVGVVLYLIRTYSVSTNTLTKVSISDDDIKIIKLLLYVYLLINFFVVILGGFIVGYTVPAIFQPFVRISQFLFPLSFLIFAPFFNKRDMIIFVLLSMVISLLAGSKAIIFNLFIALLISKLIFNENNGSKILILGLFGLITGPIMFFLVNYIRFPELFDGISFTQYLINSSDVLLYAFSEVSHRFGGYFDTLLAFMSKSSSGFDIASVEYVYEVAAGINRMVPGDIFNVSNLYLSFEEKSAYELRGIVISYLDGVGRHTESLSFARFYFLGYLGPVLFVFMFAIIYKLSMNSNIFIKLFAYYYTLDMLAGGDIQSLIVFPLNLLILYLIFRIIKMLYINVRGALNEKHYPS